MGNLRKREKVKKSPEKVKKLKKVEKLARRVQGFVSI